MNTIKIDKKKYHIKSKWEEFSYREYCEIINSATSSPIDKIVKRSGIPEKVINALPRITDFNTIASLLQFTDTPDNAMLFAPQYVDANLNIGMRKYKELEQCKIFMKQSGQPILVLDKIIKVYYGVEMTDFPCFSVISQGMFVVDEINKFLLQFKKLGEYEPTFEEKEAGIEELEKFGFFATVVEMARKYSKTHDEILNMAAIEVYRTLLYDFEVSQVNKNLNRIYAHKAKKK